ncbi:hypothetical protein QTP88_015519 [Uroleucon formosanum]
MKNTHNRVRRDNTIIAPQVQDVQRCEVEITPVRTNQPAGLQPKDTNNIPFNDFNDGNDEICVEVLKNAESAGLCNTTNYVHVRTPDEKEIAPGIFVLDIPAGTSAVNDDDDEMCLEVLDNVENLELYDIQDSYTTEGNGKRISSANTISAVKTKKARLLLVNSPGFLEISSSANRKIVWYYAKNISNFENYNSFLLSIKFELIELLKSIASKYPIKFNLKLEESIFETVTRKTNIIRPVILNQFAMIGNYIDQEFTKVEKPPKTNEEIIIFIKNLRNDVITTNPDLNFVSQLKMFATSQLAEQWAQRWSGEMSPELFVEPEVQVKPTRYSSMSPMHEDCSQARDVDDENGHDIRNCGQRAPWNTTFENLPSPTVDVNDGPDYFNQFRALSPSQFITPSPPQLTFAEHPAPVRKIKRRLF